MYDLEWAAAWSRVIYHIQCQVKFLTKVYHPGINEEGAICLPMLKDEVSVLFSSVSCPAILISAEVETRHYNVERSACGSRSVLLFIT